MGVQKDRMLAGEQYKADDPELVADSARAAALVRSFNDSDGQVPGQRDELLRELFSAYGVDSAIRPPLHVDYGYNISIGPRTFVNFGAVMLDVASITLGADVQIGPNVQLLTAEHPIDPDLRREKWESASPISIGDNVWLGGGVIVCAGVTIGENTVVGAGAVVTSDLPADVVAVGVPARVVREIDRH